MLVVDLVALGLECIPLGLDPLATGAKLVAFGLERISLGLDPLATGAKLVAFGLERISLGLDPRVIPHQSLVLSSDPVVCRLQLAGLGGSLLVGGQEPGVGGFGIRILGLKLGMRRLELTVRRLEPGVGGPELTVLGPDSIDFGLEPLVLRRDSFDLTAEPVELLEVELRGRWRPRRGCPTNRQDHSRRGP